MGNKPKYKNVVFLVEGKSERKVFSLAIPMYYDHIDTNYKVHFPISSEPSAEEETYLDIGGDITAQKGCTPHTIMGCICKQFLEKFFDETKVYPRHISEVVHIIDMDGAYIPDALIREGMNPTGARKTYYGENEILTDNVQKIIERNHRKRENIDYLVQQHSIRIRQNQDNPASKKLEVPYSIYYFSSNLDHFIHHSPNLTSKEKVSLADQFLAGYIDDIELFAQYFTDDPDSAIGMTYEESWAFIRQRDNKSLSRHTNINILLERILHSAL